MEFLPHQVKALKIHRCLQKAKNDFLEDLKNKGIFKPLEKKYFEIFKEEGVDNKTILILKNILDNQKKLNPSEEMEISAERALEKFLERMGMQNKTSNGRQIVLLTLTSDGDLYREPRKKFCYKMAKGKQQLAVLKILKPTYIKTSTICKKIDAKNEKAVRKCIGDLRAKINHRLKLKNIIESSGGNGYRINPLYELVKE